MACSHKHGSNHPHCIYHVGWSLGAWCAGCWADWKLFTGHVHGSTAGTPWQREAYEWTCAVAYGYAPQTGPAPANQLVFWPDEPPADPEVLAEALRRQWAGCAWSLRQLQTPSPN